MKGAQQLRGIRDFAVSLGLSYLPRFYRDRWIGPVAPDLSRGALVTGVIQALVCLVLFVFGYFRWLAYVGALFAQAAVSSSAEISERNFAAGAGMTALISYLLRPTTILLVYFTVEGAARFTAAIATGESVPTLPLTLVALAQRRLERRRREKFLGPCIPDLVEPVSDATSCLRIRSCRPKDWALWSPCATRESSTYSQASKALPPRGVSSIS